MADTKCLHAAAPIAIPRSEASTMTMSSRLGATSGWRWLIAFMVAAALFGAILRFATLDRKLFTNDEATTSLRVAGHRMADYYATFDGRSRTAAEIEATLQGRSAGTSPLDVAHALAVEEPQHAPLYYVIERCWQNLVGDSVWARRALSALAGSLLIVAGGWLAFELFGKPTAAVVVILIALSPFHFVYAQQAREYSLWALLVALVSALLVRAVRTNATGLWITYGLGAMLGLYTDSLFLITLIAHFSAMIATSQGRRRYREFILAVVIAVLAYGPWLWFLVNEARHGGINGVGANKYLESPLSPSIFFAKWLFQIAAVFFDTEFRWPLLAIVVLPILAVLGLTFRRFLRLRPPGTSFVIAFVFIPALLLIFPDIILHQSRSTAARYLMPTWIGIEVAAGWFLSSVIVDPKCAVRRLGTVTLAGFVVIGIVACIVQSRSEWSWTDGAVRPIGPMAEILDAAVTSGREPLVLWQAPITSVNSPAPFDFSVVELSDVVAPSVRFQQFAANATMIPTSTGGLIFLLNSTPLQRNMLLRRHYRIAPIYEFDTVGSGVAAIMHRQTQVSRRTVGFSDVASSLWRITPPR